MSACKKKQFVNSVADIVHSSVDKFGGAANKNIGDAFFVVWKFSSQKKDEDSPEIKSINPNLEDVNYIADQAVFGI